MIHAICAWLQTFPGLQGYSFTIDRLVAQPYAAGLFYKGMKQLSCRVDLMGEAIIRRQMRLRLLLNSQSPLAEFLPEFTLWAESAAAPRLGDDQLLKITGSQLYRDNGKGLCTYEISFDIEFTTGEDSL